MDPRSLELRTRIAGFTLKGAIINNVRPDPGRSGNEKLRTRKPSGDSVSLRLQNLAWNEPLVSNPPQLILRSRVRRPLTKETRVSLAPLQEAERKVAQACLGS